MALEVLYQRFSDLIKRPDGDCDDQRQLLKGTNYRVTDADFNEAFGWHPTGFSKSKLIITLQHLTVPKQSDDACDTVALMSVVNSLFSHYLKPSFFIHSIHWEASNVLTVSIIER